MKKIKTLAPIILLLIIPIIINIVFLIAYPILCFCSIFWNKENFIKRVNGFIDVIAKV